MEANEVQEQPTNQAGASHTMAEITPSQADYVAALAAGEPAMMPMSYVYALGQIEARFPRLAVEKEFAQVASQAKTNGKTDQQVFQEVLSMPQNRYLVRQMCWVFSVQGWRPISWCHATRWTLICWWIPFAQCPAPATSTWLWGAGAHRSARNVQRADGPIVGFDQIYSFTREELIQAIPRPEKYDAKKFGPAAEEMFDRIMQMADNAGATDEHRALNYLAVRYPTIFAKAAEEFDRDFSLSGVEVRPSLLNATRSIVEVIFSYTDRKTISREVFCALRCDRGVSIHGHQAIAVLRPLNLTNGKEMRHEHYEYARVYRRKLYLLV